MKSILNSRAIVGAAFLVTATAAVFSTGSATSLAGDVAKTVKRLGVVQFEPCLSWRFEFEPNAWVCQRTDFRVRVPDARDTQAEIDRLNQVIANLEQRITALEEAAGGSPNDP